MKIFLSAPKNSLKKVELELELIKDTLIKMNHIVRADHLKPRKIADKDIPEFYKKIRNQIRDSDALIAEITTPINGVGHEIYLAIEEGKPVIALFTNKGERRGGREISKDFSKPLTISYYSKKELPKLLREFCRAAKKKLDQKFIFTIEPESNKFLKWMADQKGMSKVQIVRDAFEERMREDKKYQEYLKSLEE